MHSYSVFFSFLCPFLCFIRVTAAVLFRAVLHLVRLFSVGELKYVRCAVVPLFKLFFFQFIILWGFFWFVCLFVCLLPCLFVRSFVLQFRILQPTSILYFYVSCSFVRFESMNKENEIDKV